MQPADPSKSDYAPHSYWSDRLSRHWGLHGTGYLGFTRVYNSFLYRGKQRALRRVLSELAIPVQGSAVLDIGFGTGYWLRWYAAHGATRIAGLDVAEVAVERMRAEMPELDLRHVDAGTPWPFDGGFDLVNAFDVLYHIRSDAAFENAIEQAALQLGRGGRLIVSDRVGDEDVSLQSHVRFRSRRSYERALERCGMRVEAVRPLFWLMNGGISDRPWIARRPRLMSAARLLENVSAPLLYLADGMIHEPRGTNLRLLVARRID